MSTPDNQPTYTEREAVTSNECMAIRYLDAAGWSSSELAMVFETTVDTITTHSSAECRHVELERPVRADPPTGRELKELRKRSGMTQVAVAEELDVSASAVQKWETGATPRGRLAIKLERIFDSVSLPESNDREPDSLRGRSKEYTDEDIHEAIRGVARRFGRGPTVAEYEAHRERDDPHVTTIAKRMGWSAAKEEAIER